MKKLSLLILFLMMIYSCSSTSDVFQDQWLSLESPETFTARFETTKGNFDIEAHKSWSPLGVNRLYQLIKTNYYTDIAIFRVVQDFVAQFGISNDPKLSKAWEKYPIKDEPVIAKNNFMTISFARDGKDTRAIQLFINLKDNNRLDTVDYNDVVGFPVIAKVIDGEDIILSFYDEYAEKPTSKQDEMYEQGNAYIKKNFPKVDYIKKAYLLK